MKKRNVLTMALALVLVAVLSVGATLAYLTATDTKVENKFTFAENMTVTLKEETPEPVGDETITPSTDPDHPGVSYTNVVPNQLLNKAPEISVTTDVPSYVFVKISGASDMVHPVVIANGWTALVDGTEANNFNGVYYRTATEDTDFGAIFTQVKVGNPELTGGTTVTLDNIMIEVYEIQQAGFTTVNDALAQTPFAPATPAA